MNARGTKYEARLLAMALMAVCSSAALAMPTQQELKKTQPLVAELMAPIVDDFKAKKKTAADVADAAVKYAGEAETEAAKFMLYRSSIPYYVRGEAYDRAAETVVQLKANVKDVPAEVVAEIISKATVRANKEKAPRLFELYQQAKTQATAEKDVKELRKKPASSANRRKLAEALATAGNWQEALKEFASLTDQTAQMAKGEQDGSAKSAVLGEFWWAYKPTYENAEDTFRIHAVAYYLKALAAGEITGLKKTVVEQRIRDYGGDDTAKFASTPVAVHAAVGKRDVWGNAVARKLKECDFLLNKGFKGNAKFYLCLFSASWCPPCRREMPRIAKTYAETLKDDPDIELIHFSRDQDDARALAWAKEHDVKFPVVRPKGGNPLELRTQGIPHLFIVKADGTLLEEGHPMRIFNEEKFREIKSGNVKPRTANADLKNGERTEQVDGYTWTYRLENGGAMIVAAGGKRRCTISPSPKGIVAIPSKLGGVNVTKIGSEAFCGCAGMTSVTFPASVKEICWRAFSDCRSLSSVSIPSGVTKIYPSAFSGCKSLTAIKVSDENTQYVSHDGILFDKAMKTLVCYPGGIPGAYAIPSGVTEIGGNAFSGCGGLTSVTVPDSVTRIGAFAFSQSRGLTSVSLGSGVTMLGEAPFYWCSGLTSITVSEANGRYASRNGVLFDKDMKTVICCPGGLSGEYAIPPSVTSVGRYAFDSCRKLTAVTIPASVTRIDYYGFNYCDGLTSVVIPSSVKSIGDYAFDCRGLKTVTISEGVESVGNGAFSACFELSSVKIPSSVKNIGRYAFSSCKKMTSVVMCGERPELGEKAFNNCDSLKAIQVPVNCKSWAGMKEWQGIPLVFDAGAK